MRIHMMAVGGTGMGSLAGLLKVQGHRVTGCDTALYPPMSEVIRSYGIDVEEGYSPRHLDPPPDLVIIGNAVHRDNPEARAVLDGGIEYLSMAEAIRRFVVEGRKSLVVAGTHGKTTTSALCGFLLHEAGLRPNALVGGIVVDWEGSFLWQGGEWSVLEGDEYETAFFDKGPKFLHYTPSILILNNIEMDHLDNFTNLQVLENAFVRLLGMVREGGVVIAGTESPSVARILPLANRKVETFGLSGCEDWCPTEVVYGSEGTRFRLLHGGKNVGAVWSPLYGAHNLRNVVAAMAACLEAGASMEALREALPRFRGVKRRQEVVADFGDVIFVDDFAHHPTAIRETLRGLRQRYAPRRVVVCFEPRSFTCQTGFHQETLPKALSVADEVLLGPLNAHAKIPKEERLDMERLVRDLAKEGTPASVMDTPEAYLEAAPRFMEGPVVVAFFSSGPFADLPRRLAALFAQRIKGRSGVDGGGCG